MVSCSRSAVEHVGAVVVVLQCRTLSSRCRNDDSALLASADVKQNVPDSLLFCFSFPPPSDRRLGTNVYDESVLLTQQLKKPCLLKMFFIIFLGLLHLSFFFF